MRVCTLIVRLVGLALLLYSARYVVELQLQRNPMQGLTSAFLAEGSLQGQMARSVQGALQRMFWYGVAGMVIGAVVAIFAPAVAWLLTYDAPKDQVE